MELPPWPAKCIMTSSSSGAGWLAQLTARPLPGGSAASTAARCLSSAS